MIRFLGAITSRFKPEGQNGGRNSFIIDRSVAELDQSVVLQLVRQTMTLSRRRSCATAHLGGDVTDERSIAIALGSWYSSDNGQQLEKQSDLLLSDLQAIQNDPTHVSEILKRRILLTYGSSKEGLEDCYGYGDIEPFIFESEKAGRLGLRDTFQDKLTFPQRMEVIILFDPEIKGHKHQIRYFRALLATYGIAHLLSMLKIKDPLIDAVFADEKALAQGWLSLAKRMKELSVNPY